MNWLSWMAGVGGYDLVPRRKPREPLAQLAALLRYHRTDLVIDVGANVGQYGAMLRRLGYGGRILSFEPLPHAHAELTKRAKDDPLWEVASPTALGASNGRVVIEHSAESDMSSILPQSRLLERISPTSAISERIEVEMRRLDSLDPGPFRRAHLKVDVQGFEPQVLEGAEALLPAIGSVQLEMALLPVYDGEISWQAMLADMERRGFELHLIIPGYFERKLARQLQVDGVFVRPET
ncbi:MAG: FkbM family methyltransferase [Geminicoccaceae bacterium]